MKNKLTFLVSMILLLILAMPSAGFCRGKFTVKPLFNGMWRVDENFYRAETNEREVYTYLLQPGLELGYETPKSLVSLYYTLDAHYYEDQDTVTPAMRPADDEDYTGHTGKFSLKTRPTDRILLGLEDSYHKTRDPASSDVFSDSVARDEYSINRLTPSLFYDFGPRFSAGFRYRYTETNYVKATKEDSTENRPIFDLIYNFNEKNSLDLEYQHWTRDYEQATSDYTSDQVSLILRSQFMFFTLEVGAGYHERDFDNPNLNDINLFNYRVGLIGQNPPAPEAEPRSYVALVGEKNFNDAGTGDSYYKATRITFKAGHIFREKFPLDFRAMFQNSDYETTSGLTPAGTIVLRDDDTYSLQGSIGYIVREWLLFKLAAGHEKRDSNIAGLSYDNNYCMATLEFSYSLGKR